MLDLSFCLNTLGRRIQLCPRQYQLLRRTPQSLPGTKPLDDRHHRAAFLGCEAVEALQTPIEHVDRLVRSLYTHMQELNSRLGAQLAPHLTTKTPEDYDRFAVELAAVCDVMFPAGVRTLEQLTRALMSALLNEFARLYHPSAKEQDLMWSRPPKRL